MLVSVHFILSFFGYTVVQASVLTLCGLAKVAIFTAKPKYEADTLKIE